MKTINPSTHISNTLFDTDEVIHRTFKPGHRCTLFYGDCIKLLKTLPAGSVDLIVTSPPYNMSKEYEKTLDRNDYYLTQKKIITECTRVLKHTGSICWQVGNYVKKGEIIPIDIMLYPIFNALKLQMRNRIVWHFGHGLHASKRFSGRYETIMWFTKSNDYYFNLDPVRIPQKYPHKKHFKGTKKGQFSCNPKGKNPSDVWDIPNVKSNHVEKTDHPCQFPVALVERLVLAMTQDNDLVLDPFMGTGSTAIASLKNNRRSVGAEINKNYCAIAKKRIHMTFNKSIRIRKLEQPIYQPTFLSVTP
ncbi:DNA-methyltransferase [Spirochaetota bacterium]|nr:DNA-methyltransferase [Spirochaetota bacterium]